MPARPLRKLELLSLQQTAAAPIRLGVGVRPVVVPYLLVGTAYLYTARYAIVAPEGRWPGPWVYRVSSDPRCPLLVEGDPVHNEWARSLNGAC